MGFFDNVDQYFSSPDVSSGYSGMDNYSYEPSYSDAFFADDNAYYDVSGDNSYDFLESLNDTFWDTTSNAWDSAYDDIFNSYQPVDFLTGESDDGGTWGATKDFLGSKGGLSLLGGVLGGAGRYLAADRSASQREKDRDYLAAKEQADRAWKEKQDELQRLHDEHMLEMKLAAEERTRPGPGGAEKTTSSLDKNKVDWSKKR